MAARPAVPPAGAGAWFYLFAPGGLLSRSCSLPLFRHREGDLNFRLPTGVFPSDNSITANAGTRRGRLVQPQRFHAAHRSTLAWCCPAVHPCPIVQSQPRVVMVCFQVLRFNVQLPPGARSGVLVEHPPGKAGLHRVPAPLSGCRCGRSRPAGCPPAPAKASGSRSRPK